MRIDKVLSGFLFLTVLASCHENLPSDRNARIRVKVTTEETRGTVTTNSVLEASGAFSMESYVEDDYKDYSITPATEYEAESR